MTIAWHLPRRPSTRPMRQHVPARLPGGGTVALRPLRRGETEPLEAVFDGMSLDSRAQRYFTPMTRLPSAMVAALADVDGDHHVAWVAVLGGRPVGVGRYLLDDAGVTVERSYVGEFATSLEMAGASVSLFQLDDDRLALLDSPAHSPFFREGARP